MKKVLFGILMLSVVWPMTSPLFAEDTKDTAMMGGKKMGMQMMKMMMEKSVVATSDGGVVVVAGNKITKYDQNLDVVKEIETKTDMEAMGKQMKEMMEKCPMMKEMKGKEKVVPEGPVTGSETATADEHANHH